MKNTPKINVFFEQNNNKEENFQNLDPNLTLESWTPLKKNVHNALINAPKLTNLFIRKWCLYKSEGVYYTYLTKKRYLLTRSISPSRCWCASNRAPWSCNSSWCWSNRCPCFMIMSYNSRTCSMIPVL